MLKPTLENKAYSVYVAILILEQFQHKSIASYKKALFWDTYDNYSPPIIAFWGASRRRIWTKIGGNESQDLPGPPYSPQNPRF